MESSFQQPAEQQLAQADFLLSSNDNLLLEGRSLNCLEGFVFAFTGYFGRSREQLRSIVLMRGGGYSPVVDNLVTHFVVGQNPEFSDVGMAKRLKRPMINEFMFLNIIKVRSEPPKSFTTIRIAKDQLIPQVIAKNRVLEVEHLRACDVAACNEAPPVPATCALLPQQQQTATTFTQIKPRNANNALDLVLESKKASSQPQVSTGSSKTSNPAMTPRQSENIPPDDLQFNSYCPTPTVRPTPEAQALKILKVMTIPKSPIRYRPALTKAEIQEHARRMSRIYRGREEIPEVKPDCLKGYKFVINGLLHSISRVQATELIKSCGGVAIGSVTKNATHMILGTNFGRAKLAKAEALGIQMLSEDKFSDLILDASEIPEHFEVDAEAEVAKESPPMKDEIKTNEETTVKTESPTSPAVKKELPASTISKVDVPESSVPSESQVIQITPKRVSPPTSVIDDLSFMDEYCESMMMKPGPSRNARTYRVGDWYTLNNQPTVNIDIKKHSRYPLQGKKFVISGILKTIPNREQLKRYLVECGAQVVEAVSKNVTHLIVGDEPGDTKINRAKQNGVTRIIKEDQLMLMLTDKDYEDNSSASTLDD